MTGFDIAVLLIVGFTAVAGFMRGLVQEVLALFAWICALAAIYQLHTPVSEFLVEYIGNASGASVAAFALLLIIPYAIVKVLAGWAGKHSRNSVLGPIDRVLGLGFGSVKGMILIVLGFSVLVLGYDTAWGEDGRPDWITQARTYQFVDASSDALVEKIAEHRKALKKTDEDRSEND